MSTSEAGDWSGRALPSSHTWRNKVGRAMWQLVYLLLFRPSPKFLHGWRTFLLKTFGARIGRGAVVHSSAAIWAPWNLTMGDFSAVGPGVDLYTVAELQIGSYAVISQRSTICTASHDYRRLDLPLTSAPIRIGDYAWICAEAFVCPGCQIGHRAVVQARSFVDKDVAPDTVVGGHPARMIRLRKLRDERE